MSSIVNRFAWNASKSKFLVSVAATVLLAACSADTERFAENPSDSDLVYTSSVPRQASSAPVDTADDAITSKPLGNASVKPPAYSYSKPYQASNSYQAPKYKQPAMVKQAEVKAPPQRAGRGNGTAPTC